jgi:methylmalonyl-CoA carboxyltransferase 1.3S subunit
MKLRITVDDKTYEVDVEAEEQEPAAVRLPLGAPAAAVSAQPPARPAAPGSEDEDKVCRSPIAGVVVKVAAQPGQTIEPGDILLVLEAMKMETNIAAPVAGRIAAVNVAQGDSVKRGQVLVEFE